MMHEEFESLTGLTVSLNYYTEIIEPEYAKDDIDKQIFCTQWVKTHKADICKALVQDISGMTREDAVIRAKGAEYNRLKQIVEEQRQTKESTEIEVHNLNYDIKLRHELIETLEAENKRLEQVVNQYADAANKANEIKDINEKELAAKDIEIMKLKAMLFDQMFKTA